MAFTTKGAIVNGFPGIVEGFRLYCADGSVLTGSSSSQDFKNNPSLGVQALILFFRQTYSRWYPGEGWKVENYRLVVAGQAYYWHDPADGSYGGGAAWEVPRGVLIKLGSLIPDGDYKAIINRANQDLTWGADIPPPALYVETRE